MKKPPKSIQGASKSTGKSLDLQGFFAYLYLLDFKASSKKANLTKDSLFSFLFLVTVKMTILVTW